MAYVEFSVRTPLFPRNKEQYCPEVIAVFVPQTLTGKANVLVVVEVDQVFD